MKITESKEVTTVKTIVIGKECDICGKPIEPVTKGVPFAKKNGLYFTIRTGHRDWGNDSIDSIERRDACSAECVDRAMHEYYADSSRTSYIEIERETFVSGIEDY